jgi:outer membrane protein, adhesin transport system
MAHARLQRDAFESVDKAWSARTITAERIVKLQSQVASDDKVIKAYSKEYELGQRSLIDLLNAENQLFNAQVSIESARGVAVFADYQLLAAMGKLLDYIRAPHPVDAEPLVPTSFGLIPNKLPPIMVHLPHPGAEPLNVAAPSEIPAISHDRPAEPVRPAAPETFSQRWGAIPTQSNSALGFASDVLSPKQLMHTPVWPIENAKAD